ncbi:MAG: ABC transporter permease [Clostridiales Family XIII bacterium]|jgi:putative ABC transport system permease protein|nr:ABC transporter permease [Clostridiales Family XIII bacterium]
MTSFKLALRNVKKSFRDYAIYFLTLTFGVCIFFVFNSIESQQAIMDLTNGQMGILRLLNNVMTTFSVFVSVILGALILYANRFLIRRRKKEFGIYMTLGMEKGAMSRILVSETILVGLISLGVGTAMGVLLSQGMALVTAGLLGAEIGHFEFIFSSAAMWKTVICFGAVFLLTLIFNVFMVQKQNLIDLIYADRKNETFKTPKLFLSVFLFIVAAVLLGGAYFLVSGDGVFGVQTLGVAIVLGVVGTFLFFFSLSGFFLKLLQQNKRVYLKGLNMFVLRQINSKINTTYISMTMVCLMLFISISTLSSGIGVAKGLAESMEKNIPFDAGFLVNAGFTKDGETVRDYPGVDLIRAAKEGGADLSGFAKTYWTTRYYKADGNADMDRELSDMGPRFMKLSDFNTILKNRGVDPIALAPGQFAIDSGFDNEAYVEKLTALAGRAPTIRVGGEKLKTDASLLFQYALYVTQNSGMSPTLIVPDALLDGARPAADVLHIIYKGEGREYDTQCREALKGLPLPSGVERSLETGASVRETSSTATTTIAYLAIYLGIVFLITSAAILAISQLSETSDNISRYGLLRKIGTDERMIHRALFTQILIFFGVPLALALVHAVVGISMVNRVTGMLGTGSILAGSLFMALIMLIVYGGYFFATYLGSKNMLDREYARIE